MQKAVPWGRIQAKDVKGSRDIPAFSAMANGIGMFHLYLISNYDLALRQRLPD